MSPRLASSFIIFCGGMALGACGGRQHQVLGTGRVTIGGGADAAAPPVAAPAVTAPGAAADATGRPAAIALPAQSPDGRYLVRYQIWLPRAMEVTWTVRCGDHEERGVAGETFEQYRARRTAEIQAERQRERQRRAQVGSLVGGAILGQAQAGAGVATPTASAEGSVTVDGAAAGAAAAASTVTDAPIVLAPDDLGQGYRQGEARFWLGATSGACTMEVTPLDPADDGSLVAGSFTVERWFDAKRAERVRVATVAGSARADLRAHLIAGGADPEALERRRQAEWERLEAQRAAEAQAQAEQLATLQAEAEANRAESDRVAAEAHARAELEARVRLQAELDVDAHVRASVMQTREALYVYYGKCGGNRHHREEVRAAEERHRLEIEAQARLRVRLALDVRARLRGGLVSRGADPELAARLRAEAEADARRRVAQAEADARRRAEEARRRAEAEEAAALRRATEAEARAAAQLAAYEAEQAELARRAQLADQAREEVIGTLVAMGARMRPPMPPPIEEYAGIAPSSDATWTAGHWMWNGAQWMWIEGRWLGGDAIITVDLGAGGGGGGSVGVGVGVGGTAGGSGAGWRAGAAWETEGGGAREPVREHRSTVGDSLVTPPPPREQSRDHRSQSVTTSPPPPPPPPAPPKGERERVRDHRDDPEPRPPAPAPSKDSSRPRVRDHR